MSSRQNRQRRSDRPWTVATAGAVLIAAVAAVAGCSEGPTQPSPVPLPSPSATPSPLSAVTMTGPDTIAPGGQGQYQAIAKYTDGSTKDVTANATWSSSKTEVLEIDGNGLARSRQRGIASLTVSFMSVSQTFAVRVLEPGTFVLSGTIGGADGQPLAGATVAVESGIGTGLTAAAGAQGEFDLFGVAGAVQLGVSAPGHQRRSLSLSVTRDGTTHVFLTRLTVAAEPSALTITGPDRISEYGTVQYAATLTNSDGSRQDVTNLVTWSAIWYLGNPFVIDGRGVVRTSGHGRSFVRARLGPFEHEIVVNAGSGWIVEGNITDATTGQLLPAAEFLVVGGQAYGASLDDWSGTYRLFGALGPVRLQVSRHGYVTRIVEFTVTRDAVIHVALTRAFSEHPVWDNLHHSGAASAPRRSK